MLASESAYLVLRRVLLVFRAFSPTVVDVVQAYGRTIFDRDGRGRAIRTRAPSSDALDTTGPGCPGPLARPEPTA